MVPMKAKKEDKQAKINAKIKEEPKVNPNAGLKQEIELVKAICKNSTEDLAKRINEVNLSIENLSQRLRKVESRLGLHTEGK